MYEDGIVAEVSRRLRQANLIPPVCTLILEGGADDANEVQPWKHQSGYVLVVVLGLVTPELEKQLSEVLHGLSYEVRSENQDCGIFAKQDTATVVERWRITVTGDSVEYVACNELDFGDGFVMFTDLGGEPVLFVRRTELLTLERYVETPPF